MSEEKLIPWKVGDPVGMGPSYLPDQKTRQAYGAACKGMWLDSAANHVLSLRTLNERRVAISKFSSPHRGELEDRVSKLWKTIT